MKQIKRNLSICIVIAMSFPFLAFAGNEQRVGQAGAGELLVNPWPRSAGWGGANTACVRGLESMRMNIAGLAFTRKTEMMFARTIWLAGADININAFGFAQKVGEFGALGVSVMTVDFGKIEKTTVFNPEGGLGEFHPTYTNVGVSYARAFSNSIYGGAVIRVIDERITNLGAAGVSLDAGIQYITGKMDQIKFGMSMKNVGPPMKFSGDGVSFRGETETEVSMTVEQRSADFELPSLITIGGSYDFFLVSRSDSAGEDTQGDKITLAANFTSNSFTKDQYHIGLEYNYRNILMLRGGYVFEEGLTSEEERSTAYSGPCGGASVQLPISKTGSVVSFEYAYRLNYSFTGTHTLGLRISL